MNKCPNCDNVLIENSKFCSNCGEKVIEIGMDDLHKNSLDSNEDADDNTINEQKRNIVKRVKLIIIRPKQEWLQIKHKNPGITKMLFLYLLPLALIPMISLIIGYGVIGDRNSITNPFIWLRDMKAGIVYGSGFFITCMLTPVLTAIIINSISHYFNLERNITKALQLTIYSYTPVMIAGVLFIIPIFSFLAYLGGFYGIILVMFGVSKLMDVPKDKTVAYFFTVIGILYGIHFILIILLRVLAFFFYIDGLNNIVQL